MPNLRISVAAIAIGACLSALAESAAAGYFPAKTITIVRAPDGRPCTFFILDGVSPADPSTPNTPWMALRQSHPGYKENLAILMSAKLTNRPVNVATSGTVPPECGHVEVTVVELL